MPYGYAGKILEVNLSKKEVETATIDEEVLKQYIGGRGLSAKILWDRLGEKWRKVDPLGPENPLIISTGPLTGFIPGGRVCVSGKSPASNGITASTAGGEFPIELKSAGFDGIIFSGRAEKPVYLLVTDGEAEIRGAKRLWGLTGQQTVKEVNREVRKLLREREPDYGPWKEPGILYIGPAGETLNRTAAILQKWTHACGYGGYGALMGSKKLKAVAVKGTGPMPEVASPGEIAPLLDKFYESAFGNWQMRWWGTGHMGYWFGHDTSSEPVRNWQEEWHDEKGMAAVNFENRCWVKRYWSDWGCPISCMKLACVRWGPFKGAITDNPDYELQAYCGTNLGIFEPEANVYVSAVIDDLGLSGINSANVMGFAAELFQRGILTKEDFGGIEPKWGDGLAFGRLAELIARREKIGDILAEGTYRAAKEISKIKGVDVTKYAVHVKGIEIGAHGIRSGLDYTHPASFAFSVQGGDHTSVSARSPSALATEPMEALCDTMVYCMIGMMGTSRELIWSLFKAVTGRDMNDDEWSNIYGRRIIQIQRAALLLGGPDVIWNPAEDDDNPPRFYEPLPSGPKAGSAPTKAEFLEVKKKTYEAMGWDENGVPTSRELKKLGLTDVDRVLGEIRR
jgi:aldehyde:ferredoxin oxidoreductase